MPTYAVNKRARFDYEILESFEAGIVLTGPEVKAVRMGQVSLKEAYVTIHQGTVRLTNAHISAYKPAQLQNYDPTRSRILLLHQREISYLTGKLKEQGFTAIPLDVHTSHGRIKVTVGLGRGKKQYDKREDLKKKDMQREIDREVRGKE